MVLRSWEMLSLILIVQKGSCAPEGGRLTSPREQEKRSHNQSH